MDEIPVCVCAVWCSWISVERWQVEIVNVCIERILFVDVMDEMAASDHRFCSFDFELIFLTMKREMMTMMWWWWNEYADKRIIILLQVEDLLFINHQDWWMKEWLNVIRPKFLSLMFKIHLSHRFLFSPTYLISTSRHIRKFEQQINHQNLFDKVRVLSINLSGINDVKQHVDVRALLFIREQVEWMTG